MRDDFYPDYGPGTGHDRDGQDGRWGPVSLGCLIAGLAGLLLLGRSETPLSVSVWSSVLSLVLGRWARARGETGWPRSVGRTCALVTLGICAAFLVIAVVVLLFFGSALLDLANRL